MPKENNMTFIRIKGVKCFLIHEEPWAEFYEGIDSRGKKYRATVSKFKNLSNLSFFDEHSPFQYNKKELINIVMCFAHRDYLNLSIEWQTVIREIKKTMY